MNSEGGASMSDRTFMVVAHSGRDAVTTTLTTIAKRCADAGVAVRLVDHDLHDSGHPDQTAAADPIDPEILRRTGADIDVTDPVSASAAGCEIVIVLGGDGTFLRAAELAYPSSVPLMGINLGHIGFLAEAESHRVDEMLDMLISGRYRVEDRMVLDVTVSDPGAPAPRSRTWALNEVVIQNKAKSGVLELVTEVDGRPVSAFGADGLLVATPTGSTAYAFSAGGPVMWPDLEAILVVPSNAHALFARPMVTSPRSRVAVEIHRGGRDGVALCDGRRVIDVPAGSRIEVVRAPRSLRWVRIDSEPFADRLVTKFSLPVTGWRGRS